MSLAVLLRLTIPDALYVIGAVVLSAEDAEDAQLAISNLARPLQCSSRLDNQESEA
jgi:hypothetical protein